MSLQVYGIPNCGTCKKAIQWLEDKQIDYQFINTKEQPPSQQAIAKTEQIRNLLVLHFDVRKVGSNQTHVGY